jgi:hypothetical protein
MNDAPFTSTFSKNSPPRIGHYIGWQIVRECMLNNPEMELIDLFNEIQSQKNPSTFQIQAKKEIIMCLFLNALVAFICFSFVKISYTSIFLIATYNFMKTIVFLLNV